MSDIWSFKCARKLWRAAKWEKGGRGGRFFGELVEEKLAAYRFQGPCQ